MNTYSLSRLASLGLLATLALSACSKDELKTGTLDTTRFTLPAEGSALYLTDALGIEGASSFSLLEEGATSSELFLRQTTSAEQDIRATVTIDPAALASYNASHQTAYPLLPEGAALLPEGGGELTLKKGQTTSPAFAIRFDSSKLPAATASTAVYLLPLKVVLPLEGTSKTRESHYFLLVKDERVSGSAAKASGIKIFSCPEVNDTNPLNTLSFTLKKSGKPLIDAVILFSSNINYDERTGRVYIHHNENVTALLANKDKYLKPLKDRGIKVLLSILGNHDRAGVANLSDASARLFAQEVKNTCDAYDLDGVMLDDEYSKYYEATGKPGFVRPSPSAMARLYLEIKKLQPHRWNVVYVYGSSSSLPSVDGQRPGQFIDYALHDYGGTYDLSYSFPGLPKERWGMSSQEYAQGRFAWDNALNTIRTGGYKTHLIFAMDPYRANFSDQLSSMQRMARIFYDDELVFDGKKYPKDWK